MPGRANITPVSHAQFQTTHWSVVLAARQDGTAEASQALESLCTDYWYPIYAWLRRQNHPPHDAQDLTQSFLVHLLDGQRLQTVHPDKGRFRSFLLASLKNFLANERDRAQALKRGGQFQFVSVDETEGEARLAREPVAPGRTPDRAFEQSWATTLLETVLARLSQEYAAAGKTAVFETLRECLSGDREAVSYRDVAARFQLTESGIKMIVLRMRRRFGELLRVEIARTVGRPEEVDEEIRSLFAAVSG